MTSAPTIVLRSPNPGQLANFYEGLGFKTKHVGSPYEAYFSFQEGLGTLEILQMDRAARPSPPKKSRTEQGVLIIFETDDLSEVVRRAETMNSSLIEKYVGSKPEYVLYYIQDTDNNLIGFRQRPSAAAR